VKTYEYQTRVIDVKGFWGGKVDPHELDRTLNDMGFMGWRLVEMTPSTQSYGNTRWLVCVFERETRQQ